ncbi:transposase [Sulfobacillus acidophilus TPY]|nr:transposase [Sulfobacillus acidophilus TPY]
MTGTDALAKFHETWDNLSRQTLANGVIYAAQTWLKPVYEALKQALVHRDIVQADETTLTVVHEPGRRAEQKSYMWLYRSGRDGPPIVLYEYQPGRHGAYARKFLTGFRGYLQCDGYAGYREVPDATLVGCWAHARRNDKLAVMASRSSPRQKIRHLMAA